MSQKLKAGELLAINSQDDLNDLAKNRIKDTVEKGK